MVANRVKAHWKSQRWAVARLKFDTMNRPLRGRMGVRAFASIARRDRSPSVRRSRHACPGAAPNPLGAHRCSGGAHRVLPSRASRLFVTAALSRSTMLARTSCSSGAATEAIPVAGATPCLPLADQAAELFKEETGSGVRVSGRGSSAGSEAVSTGPAELATSARGLNAEEQKLGLTCSPGRRAARERRRRRSPSRARRPACRSQTRRPSCSRRRPDPASA